MKPSRSFTLTLVVLSFAAVTQWLLQKHVEAVGKPQHEDLIHPLAKLPMKLGDWIGEDRQVDDPKLLYGDDHIRRDYKHKATGQRLMIWIAYSSSGKDRTHHPEICMAVAGKPEQEESRREIELPGLGDPIQQFSFGHPGTQQWVYYWYYSLPLKASSIEAETFLQRRFQKWRYRPASVTIEVFAPKGQTKDSESSRQFVKQLDKAMQEIVGKGAVRGSERIPVTRID